MPNASKVVKKLNELNIYSSIISNTYVQFLNRIIKKYGLSKYFLNVIGTRGDVAYRKPTKEVVDYALIGADIEDVNCDTVWMIGNSMQDVQTAYNANIRPVIFGYELLNQIIDVLPEGPLYYPDDQLSDRDMRFQVKEIIREKTLLLLDKEVPHCLAVEIDSYKEQKKQIEIHASIIVEKPSQKGIVIGKNGQMIKKIGTLARKDIEKIENTHVILNLYVKVESDWRNKNSLLKSFGYLKQNN